MVKMLLFLCEAYDDVCKEKLRTFDDGYILP